MRYFGSSFALMQERLKGAPMLKQMSLRQILLISLSTLMPVLSMAGVSDGAGGLSIEGKVIESYIVTPKKPMPDFDKLDPLIKSLGNKVPSFGRLLNKVVHPDRNDVKAPTWFYLPGKNPCALIQAKTKIVATKFGCQMGSEIYISQANLPKNAIERRDAYFHEALLMVSQNHSEEHVHKIIAFLKRNDYDPSEKGLQEAMLETGLVFMARGWGAGNSLTKTEEDQIQARHEIAKKIITETNDDSVNQFLDEVLENCKGVKEEDGLEKFQTSLNELVLNPDVDITSIGRKVQTGVIVFTPQLNGDDEEEERSYAVENYLTKFLQIDHMASLLAALDMGSPSQEWNDNGGHMYPGKLGKWIAGQQPFTDIDARITFRWSSGQKIELLEKKYQKYSVAQRQAQVCSDAKAMRP